MPRPSDSLLLDVVENWRRSNHFSDLGVLDLNASGCVDGSPQTSNLGHRISQVIFRSRLLVRYHVRLW